MQALILAAGQGTRIREHHHLPKGFIELNEKPIIQSSVEKLKAAGVESILIVTGYGCEHYQEFAKGDDKVSTLFNPRYHDYSSLYSLYCARDWVKGDFLLLESDIFYEARALDLLQKDAHKDAILVSGWTHSSDEVYVEIQEGALTRMSKKKEELDSSRLAGEFVGITKLSFSTFNTLIALAEADSSLLTGGYYEEGGLVALAKKNKVHCCQVEDLRWCEIDDLEHLKRAQELFAPAFS